MTVPDAKRLKELKTENGRLKKMLTRVLDRLALSRGLPNVIRTDNGKEFCGRAMVTWAHERGVQLRLIQPGKPNQNAHKSPSVSLMRSTVGSAWETLGALQAVTLSAIRMTARVKRTLTASRHAAAIGVW